MSLRDNSTKIYIDLYIVCLRLWCSTVWQHPGSVLPVLLVVSSKGNSAIVHVLRTLTPLTLSEGNINNEKQQRQGFTGICLVFFCV